MARKAPALESGFLSGRKPAWKEIGTDTKEAKTVEDALHIAGLDWEVYKSEKPVSVTVDGYDGGEELVEARDKYLTYRYNPKTKKADSLGVVGDRYTTVQNSEAFSFLNYMVDEAGVTIDSAGSIDGGRKVWVAMDLPNGIKVGGFDAVDLSLLAWNSHDGTSAFKLCVTPVRIVCTNKLNAAVKGAQNSFSMRHTPSVTGKIQLAREALGITFAYVDEFQREAELLLSQKMTDKEFQKMIEVMIPKQETERVTNLADEARSTLLSLWKSDTQQNILNTKWAAYNTFTEYADWFKPTRGNRAEKVLDGSTDAFTNKALAYLV